MHKNYNTGKEKCRPGDMTTKSGSDNGDFAVKTEKASVKYWGSGGGGDKKAPSHQKESAPKEETKENYAEAPAEDKADGAY